MNNLQIKFKSICGCHFVETTADLLNRACEGDLSQHPEYVIDLYDAFSGRKTNWSDALAMARTLKIHTSVLSKPVLVN